MYAGKLDHSAAGALPCRAARLSRAWLMLLGKFLLTGIILAAAF
ncbi:hypothetical protein [Bradyrhizobium sp. AC87j1]|nr:hypothetical protein [Bradyrhizobium sp. AC87j1]